MTDPHWYDVLDVEPTASTEEIRDAWRAAIADLTPADRRFRLYNEAAEVLLDDQRRAAYDATLAAEHTAETAEPELPHEPEPEPVPAPTPAAATGDRAPRTLPAVSTGLLAGLAVLTVLAVALAGWLFTQPSSGAVDDATASARAAAEQAVVPVLSYDYRDLEAGRERARDYLTTGYREDYDQLYDGLVTGNAGSTKTVVAAEFVASAVVRGGEDRAEVLVFVNQATTNAQSTQPVVYRNQVRMQMERVDGEWLVDCMVTQPGGDCDS